MLDGQAVDLIHPHCLWKVRSLVLETNVFKECKDPEACAGTGTA